MLPRYSACTKTLSPTVVLLPITPGNHQVVATARHNGPSSDRPSNLEAISGASTMSGVTHRAVLAGTAAVVGRTMTSTRPEAVVPVTVVLSLKTNQNIAAYQHRSIIINIEVYKFYGINIRYHQLVSRDGVTLTSV